MGFEQLAALKAQLTKEAKLKKQQEQAAEKPAAKQGPKHAPRPGPKPGAAPSAKGDRPARAARPSGNARPSEKSAPPVDPVVRVIGKLQKRFPAAFPKNPAPKVPLKVGILADLIAQASELQLSEAEVREAVSTWCRGSRYWACLTDGAARVDLTGASAGVVTARDAAFARNQAKGGAGGRRKPKEKAGAVQAGAVQAGAAQNSGDVAAGAAQTNEAPQASEAPAAGDAPLQEVSRDQPQG
ncbi:ProQ/FINO family protein [Trinickia sp.]|uniref:ProQ/FinO family protein n=1 Tax=Trinickia sp. TaxID=2571163 RepID=UPI003F7E5704